MSLSDENNAMSATKSRPETGHPHRAVGREHRLAEAMGASPAIDENDFIFHFTDRY